MRPRTLTRSLLFAAVAGLAYMPFALVGSHVARGSTLLSLYFVLATALYIGSVAPRLAQGVRVALLVLAAGLAVTFIATSPLAVAVAMAAVLGLSRALFLYRANVGRGLFIEVMLGVSSLAIGGFVIGFSLVEEALAIWAFFLVQSTFFLLGGVHDRPQPRAGEDPFDAAVARATELMGRP